jgi:inhibitor of KinA
LTRSSTPELLHAGDSCLVIEFGDTIDLTVNGKVQQLRRSLEKHPLPGMLEMVPTYRSLALYFDPLATDTDRLLQTVRELALVTEDFPSGGGTVMIVPVLYGGEEGPDLQTVASHNGLTVEDVIKRHSERDYYCYMLGFTPGFPYLGGMDETIATPRLQNPRTLIPAGSVGIAGRQTGIYPIDSPGGWQLIGRTPLRLFDPDGEPPILIDAGLWVRFQPIDREEYHAVAEAVASGKYRPQISPCKEDER